MWTKDESMDKQETRRERGVSTANVDEDESTHKREAR